MPKDKCARYALGAIRLVNGALALLATKRLLRMLRVDPETNGAAFYALRLFGIRTVLLGLHMFIDEGDALERTLREAVVIHLSDTVSAAVSGLTSELPARSAAMATAISSMNTALAVLAKRAGSEERTNG
jgi:hypothetical protein